MYENEAFLVKSTVDDSQLLNRRPCLQFQIDNRTSIVFSVKVASCLLIDATSYKSAVDVCPCILLIN